MISLNLYHKKMPPVFPRLRLTGDLFFACHLYIYIYISPASKAFFGAAAFKFGHLHYNYKYWTPTPIKPHL